MRGDRAVARELLRRGRRRHGRHAGLHRPALLVPEQRAAVAAAAAAAAASSSAAAAAVVVPGGDGPVALGGPLLELVLRPQALALVLGVKRCEMVPAHDAQRITGYVVGGISPFGQKKKLFTVVDVSAMDLPTMFVSGGRRGLDIEVAPADLIRVRKLAYPALERLGSTLLDDVALPVTKIAEFVGLVERLATKHNLTIGIFGHAGDGNMHPTIVHDHGDAEGEKRAKLAFSEIVRIAQSLGGSASGEHGIGSIKRELVTDEISHSVIEIQRGIKKLLDPSGILNPGKKLP